MDQYLRTKHKIEQALNKEVYFDNTACDTDSGEFAFYWTGHQEFTTDEIAVLAKSGIKLLRITPYEGKLLIEIADSEVRRVKA